MRRITKDENPISTFRMICNTLRIETNFFQWVSLRLMKNKVLIYQAFLFPFTNIQSNTRDKVNQR